MADFWAKGRAIHQLVVGAVPGDAITGEAFMIRDWLRAAGAKSELFAERIHTKLEGQVKPYHQCQIDTARGDRVIFHYSIGSDLSSFVRGLPPPVAMIYHNVTPPQFFKGADAETLAGVERGRNELGSFANVLLAMADSEFNRRELVDAGYDDPVVLPLAVDTSRLSLVPDQRVMERYDDDVTNLVFVGRLSPNKRQEDVIKAFSYYKRINEHSRLFLVGGAFTASYKAWLERFARSLGLGRSVVLTDHVTDDELVAYYRLSRVFVCMSEHEGFGVPLIECMEMGLPIVAFASSAVPDTLGEAGVLVHEKNYPVIAEIINLLATDGPVRQAAIAAGKRRALDFTPNAVRSRFTSLMKTIL